MASAIFFAFELTVPASTPCTLQETVTVRLPL